jgi:putative DNA primase/helicase
VNINLKIDPIQKSQCSKPPSAAKLLQHHRPLQWLWPGWIPRGALTLLTAPRSSGKTLVALDLANRILNGASFPDGQPTPCPGGPILYVTVEAHLLIERASAWQVDLKRIFLKYIDYDSFFDFSSQDQCEILSEEITFVQPDLVIFDSLPDITGRAEPRRASLQRLLVFLNQLAYDNEAGLILIHHTRQRRQRRVNIKIDNDLGSMHYYTLAHSILGLVSLNPSLDNSPRLFGVQKSNLAAIPKPLVMEILEKSDGVDLQWGPPANLTTPT